ncbi:MAG TPA: DUF4835 family protein [Bacteroidales bacterium]|nr:DUF4835 family protein [Bacteroidales bacterium]
MRKLIVYGFFLIFGLWNGAGVAQELNCIVVINSPGLQETDRRILHTLQTDLMEFVNQRTWTQYKFLPQERIEASITLTINERNNDLFRGTIQIQSRRPVFQTSYNSPMFNHLDRDVEFLYQEGQPLEFADNVFTSNLTSLIAFYVYVILGFDFDSFAPLGGNAFFEKAQNIVNQAQNTHERGWKSFEGQRNRYWLIENMFNTAYRPVREAMYKYHRLGFDIMTQNVGMARQQVIAALEMIQNANRQRPGSFLIQIILTTKGDEMVNLFSQSAPAERTRAIALLSELDPANSAKYQRINEDSGIGVR